MMCALIPFPSALGFAYLALLLPRGWLGSWLAAFLGVAMCAGIIPQIWASLPWVGGWAGPLGPRAGSFGGGAVVVPC